jgi:uncharacterized protein YggU (UPF0235/DUF167 family)
VIELSATVSVRLRPRAGRDALEGWRDGVLYARVAAPPGSTARPTGRYGLVAGALGVASSRVALVRGERGREKVLRIEGVDAARARDRLGG